MIIELKAHLAVKEPASGELLATPESAAPFLKDMRDLAQEVFCVLTLNAKNRVIRRHLVSLGTASSTLVHAREVFRPAITDGASSVLLAHNHPSGDPVPSAEDLRITKSLIEAGRHIDISVVDHLIVGDGQTLSLRETGLVQFTP